MRWLGKTALAGLACCLLMTAAAAAEEAQGAKLLRPDSLLGWEHGERPSGWTVADGQLTGAAEANELVGGWTVGDFELTLNFSATPGAALVLGFPEAPQGKGKLEVHLSAGDQCGRIQIGNRILFPGKTPTPVKAERPVTVKRTGAALSLEIDNQPYCQVELPDATQRYGLSLAVQGGDGAALSDLRLKEPLGPSIFNEKDLTGWWTPGNKDAWQVEGDELVKRGRGGNYLRTEKEYANFTLSFQYKISKGGNSGVGIRTARNGWPSGDGMELQLLDHPAVNFGSNMSIYRNVAPVAVAHKSEDWNDAVIKAEGYVISAWVNGELVQHHNTYFHPELRHRHLTGWIGFQDHGGVDQFRKIRVLEMPDGRGFEPWYRPRTPRGAEVVLDRIMNHERLSLDDRVRSGAVLAKSHDNADELLVAELTGPGAVVQVSFTGDGGRLAFYFDGEEKPRIDVPARNLHGAAPRLTDFNQPVLTYLAYSKSLKIVARGGQDSKYLVEYVTLPPEVEVETFVDKSASIPSGWLAAIDYRHNHHKYGTVREADIYPRQDTGNKKIEPGASTTLIELPGAGLVHWLRLKCDRALLAGDDLWVEVHVDGGHSPAVSAPARFLFAAVADGQSHNNFVMLNRGGAISKLAMPYGAGITISAVNKGNSPMGGIGATVSYEPDDDGRLGYSQRMRLRGRFDNAKDGTPGRTIELKGPGRLVGLVLEPAAEDGLVVASVKIDSRPQPGWAGLSSDLLLGAPDGESQFRRCLSGRAGGLAWRYFLLAPWDFAESLQIEHGGHPTGSRLLLYYGKLP